MAQGDIYLPAESAEGRAREAARNRQQSARRFAIQHQPSAAAPTTKPAPTRAATIRDAYRRFTGRR